MEKEIWILNHHASTPLSGGGADRHYELALYLDRRGYKVKVFASSYSHFKKEYIFNNKIFEEKIGSRSKVIWIKTGPTYGNIINRFLNYKDYYRKMKNIYINYSKPDIVIGSSVHPLAWVAAEYISEKTGARLIAEVRDLWPLSIKENLGEMYIFPKIYFESLENRIYKKSDYIITTMAYGNEYIKERYNIDNDKIKYIPHAIDINKFNLNLIKYREDIPQQIREVLTKEFCCVYTGALSKSEGLEYFIKASLYMKNKNIKLILIGGGGERENLKQIIKDNNLENVYMFDKVDRKVIPAILSLSKILFCGLSDKEVFNYGISKNKFYDYFLSKKPLIFASNVRGSIVDLANAGFTIRAEDSKLIAEHIDHIYENYTYILNKFGDNGYKYVENNHNIDLIMNRFEEIILGD